MPSTETLPPGAHPEVPVYLPTGDAEGSFKAFQADPIGYHLKGYATHGAIYQTWFRNRWWIAIGGLEANDFVWSNPDLWSYTEANAPFLDEMGDDHVTALEGDHHEQKRAILKPAFTKRAAMRFLPRQNAFYRDLMQRQLASGERIELVHFWTEQITRLNARTVAQADIPDEAFADMAVWEVLFLRGLFLDDARPPYIERERYRKLKEKTLGIFRRIVDERLEDPDVIDDNFGAVLKNRIEVEGPHPDRTRLVNDLYFVLLAGGDNISALNNYALTFLFHPENAGWLARLREEVDAWDPDDAEGVMNLHRVKATVMETQRIRPGAFVLNKKNKRAFTFNGYEISEGTDILHLNNLGHFLEELYPDPFTFNPERFMEKQRFVPKSFGFFGGGSHVCLGRNHALIHTPLALAHLVRAGDLVFDDPIDLHPRASYSAGRIERQLWARLVPRG
ncbi:MAG: cytochrome P450 [Opitutales bacterium]